MYSIGGSWAPCPRAFRPTYGTVCCSSSATDVVQCMYYYRHTHMLSCRYRNADQVGCCTACQRDPLCQPLPPGASQKVQAALSLVQDCSTAALWAAGRPARYGQLGSPLLERLFLIWNLAPFQKRGTIHFRRQHLRRCIGSNLARVGQDTRYSCPLQVLVLGADQAVSVSACYADHMECEQWANPAMNTVHTSQSTHSHHTNDACVQEQQHLLRPLHHITVALPYTVA